MARIHQQKARKSYKCGRCQTEINPGDMYYSWKNRYSSKKYRCSKHYPRRSEMTTSDKLSGLYAAEESVSDAISEVRQSGMVDDLIDALRNAAEEIRQVGEEYQESYDNMSQYFESSDTMDEIEQKVSDCEEWASELEQAADDIENEWSSGITTTDDEEENEAAQDELIEQLCDKADEIYCPF